MGCDSESTRKGGAQAFLGQITAVGVQPVEVGNLDLQNLLDGVSLLDHATGSVEAGVIRSAWPRG